MPNSKDYPITIDHIKANCPEWVRFIAADEDGSVWGYESSPIHNDESFRRPPPRGAVVLISRRCRLGCIPWYSDWRESLVEVVREPFCLGHELKSRRMGNTRQAAIIEAQARLIEALEEEKDVLDTYGDNLCTINESEPKCQRLLKKLGIARRKTINARADLDALMGGEK